MSSIRFFWGHYKQRSYKNCNHLVFRLLLETKFRRLPVVDADGKLVSIPILLLSAV